MFAIYMMQNQDYKSEPFYTGYLLDICVCRISLIR